MRTVRSSWFRCLGPSWAVKLRRRLWGETATTPRQRLDMRGDGVQERAYAQRHPTHEKHPTVHTRRTNSGETGGHGPSIHNQ